MEIEKQYKNESIDEFLTMLAGKDATPGGGGAAALAGALGIALGNMVGSLTVGKKSYADVEPEIKEMNEKAEKLRDEFLALIDEDEKCFKPLSEAYKMPVNTEEEKAEKEKRIEECSKEACRAPMDIIKKSCEALELIKAYCEKGSRLAVSDAGCAAVLCKAAIQAAALNIYINTKYINNDEATKINQQVKELVDSCSMQADIIYTGVELSLILS